MEEMQPVEQTVQLQEVLDLLMATPAGLSLVEERNRQERRRKLVAEIADLRRQELAIPAREQAVLDLAPQVEEAHRRYLAARDAYLAAADEVRILRLTVSNNILRREGELRQSADPVIAAFIDRCWKSRQEAQNSFIARPVPLERNLLSDSIRRPITYVTNTDEIQQTVAALRAAVTDAEALQLECLPPAEVLDRLAEIEARIPQQENAPYILELSLREVGQHIQGECDLIKISHYAREHMRERKAFRQHLRTR